jgi:hypothetical protein
MQIASQLAPWKVVNREENILFKALQFQKIHKQHWSGITYVLQLLNPLTLIT